MVINNNLRLTIAETICKAHEGHIPSAFSIVEILNVLYGNFLRYNAGFPKWEGRDYFILSKGHGGTALYAILHKYGFITKKDLDEKSTFNAILGGHPDSTKVPGVEASAGSLGHGALTAMGIALGLKIRKKKNRVISLIGDGESNEGTIWEMALVAANLKLGNYLVIVDNNHSTEQILPVPDMLKKWSAFGWEAYDVDGHDEKKILKILRKLKFTLNGKPKIIIANTVKGRGVSFLEGHGIWHHKIPTEEEMDRIRKELMS